MSYAPATTPHQVQAVSLFKGVSNAKLAQLLSEDRAKAFKETGAELGPVFLKIARGEPVDLEKPATPAPTKTGTISGFFARLGL